MATTGTNYTAKWELANGTLTISPVSGNSGEMRGPWTFRNTSPYIKKVIDMTDEEWLSVVRIVFEGNISIKESNFDGTAYTPRASWMFSQGNALMGDVTLSNVVYIDIRGLNTTGCTSFSSMFARLSSLTGIVGLDTLVTSSSDDYSSMFSGTAISELNLSSFENMNTANIENMIDGMNYLATVVFPINFSRKSPKQNNTETDYYMFGIAKWNVQAINPQTQVTISSDNDFFALETGQGGTWIRDISGSATLLFKINSVQRDGNNVTVSYSYATSTATAYVYLKESSASSFPQNPTTSIPLSGTGNDSFTLTLSTDGSYEMQIIVTDGNTNLYVFASIDSNVLLMEIDTAGNTKQSGRATTKDMTTQEVDDFVDELSINGAGLDTTQSEAITKNDLKSILNNLLPIFYPVGSYYETSDTTFNPNTEWGGTWELELAGQVHVSSGTGYAVSGALTNTSDGGSRYIQAHTHTFTQPTITSYLRSTVSYGSGSAARPYTSSGSSSTKDWAKASGGAVGAVSGATTGNGNNMPPYIVVNRWHRTA